MEYPDGDDGTRGRDDGTRDRVADHLHGYVARHSRVGRSLRYGGTSEWREHVEGRLARRRGEEPVGGDAEALRRRAERFPEVAADRREEEARADEQARRFARFDRARRAGIDYTGAFERHREDPPYDGIARVDGWRNFINYVVERARPEHVHVNEDGVAEIDLRAIIRDSRTYESFVDRLGRARQTIACQIDGDGVRVFHVGPFG